MASWQNSAWRWASFVALSARSLAATVGFQALRYDEDYSGLRHEPPATTIPERLKFIPLDATGDAWLTFGGESRSRYEYFRHAQWGAGPQDDNGYFLQRTMLHADWHPHDRVRVFAQLKSGLETGRTGGPRGTDEDQLDLNQAFVDVNWPASTDTAVTWRLGRQEIALGSWRLLSPREAPNVRLAFEGARAIFVHHRWRIDALAVRPVQTARGVFDDHADRSQKLWGLYAVLPLSADRRTSLDVYYLGYERDAGRFASGVAHENRQTVGSRLWGNLGNWDYNGEAVLQGGRFGASSIHAWMLSLDTGYTFPALPGKPRVGVKGGIASGDRDPTDNTLGTYNALFPRGAYFHESGLIGPANIIAVHPSVTVQATATTKLSFDCDFFWRQSDRDGVYGTAVNLVRPGLDVDGHALGTQPSVRLEWRPTRHWLVAATAARFLAAAFFRRTGSGRDVDYFSTWTTYTF